MGLKPPLSFEDQVKRLAENGMKINDYEETEKTLAEINYYRFTGYAIQFRVKPSLSAYKVGTSFDDVHKIYLFDAELRNLLKVYLEIIEILYRTRISYGFSMSKCKDFPHDGHHNAKNFFNKNGYLKIMESFRREEKYNRDSLIVKHHIEKYEDKMPLWVMVELMSFSNLSKLFNAMYFHEQEIIAGYFKTKADILSNHLHCLSNLRNKCAHGARLYNVEMRPPTKLGKKTLTENKDLNNSSLFAYIIVLVRKLPSARKKKELVDCFLNLIVKYNEFIDISCLGCPDNYENILKAELK